MTNSEDEWFFESIQMYKNLYMYDLQQPVTAMDWIDDGRRLFVAVSNGKKHELTEMTLPDKVLKSDNENSGLIKDRDFRIINGGFCDHPVEVVKHIPGTRTVCTCPKVSSEISMIELWQLGTDDTDLIQKICDMKNPKSKGHACKVTTLHGGSLIVFGSHIDNLCVADTNTQQIIIDSQGIENTDLISVLHSIDENKLVCCCQNSGDIMVLDKREKFKIIDSYTNPSNSEVMYWTQDIGNMKQNPRYVLQLSTSGLINIVDLRNLSSCVGCFNTGLTETEKVKIQHLKISQNNEENFSVSGYDSNVYVYHLKSMLTKSTSDNILTPLFIHEGHLKNSSDQSKDTTVVTHLWHPWQQDLILSAANDGSLHGWQYNSEYCKKS